MREEYEFPDDYNPSTDTNINRACEYYNRLYACSDPYDSDARLEEWKAERGTVNPLPIVRRSVVDGKIVIEIKPDIALLTKEERSAIPMGTIKHLSEEDRTKLFNIDPHIAYTYRTVVLQEPIEFLGQKYDSSGRRVVNKD